MVLRALRGMGIGNGLNVLYLTSTKGLIPLRDGYQHTLYNVSWNQI